MKKKTIKVTHIDTAGHGYLSVSKADFLLVGCDPNKITGYSGHTFTRLYLEEDSDASYFMEVAKANGFNVVVKSGYNPKFNITHNYNPQLFDFKAEVGHIIKLSDGNQYKITDIRPNGRIIVMHTVSLILYNINKRNPFEHITDWLKWVNQPIKPFSL
jgi:hypothetical protein